jgi:hypothetical protein
MRLASVWDGGFRLVGTCPHCGAKAAFETVSKFFIEEDANGSPNRIVGTLRCAGCNEYILGILRFEGDIFGGSGKPSVYDSHYPLGKPDDSVSDDVPDGVKEDFKEALRCHWIGAFKAAVLMCRRSLQVSCDREGAQGRDLFSQIDDLAANQHITEPLKRMAHRIRLLGKKGAHGDFSDIDDTIGEQDAADAIKFMRHYLEHVYELPARLDSGQP